MKRNNEMGLKLLTNFFITSLLERFYTGNLQWIREKTLVYDSLIKFESETQIISYFV